MGGAQWQKHLVETMLHIEERVDEYAAARAENQVISGAQEERQQ